VCLCLAGLGNGNTTVLCCGALRYVVVRCSVSPCVAVRVCVVVCCDVVQCVGNGNRTFLCCSKLR